MNVQYAGENLWPGMGGKVMIIAAFVFAVLAMLAYISSINKKDDISNKMLKRADFLFAFHSVSIFIASLFLFYILLNRFYEYRYVWIHTENSLGTEYLVAAFWAGQEGSLLFWTLCQVVFGLLLIRYSGRWKPQVMVVIAISQAFMTSLMLGINIGGTQVGMSPFILLREASENIGNTFFDNPGYLQSITDGNGLNPLLRNFWMLSHPPILFVGFAAALVPFAYAVAGLWTKNYHDWIKPALPWTLGAILFLGAGLILGGVWAYESLTFGGFWAWDPVENASLVPWLILIASLHLMLLSGKTKNSYLPAFIFTILSFIFVIYSTFLTRSGVLADTSVHSFGNDGMGMHILLYILTFIAIGGYFIIRNAGRFPADNKSKFFSREFWLFAGSLVIILSAFQIIFTTSLPVINKLTGANLAPPTNVVEHYNTWQTPFAIIIAFMIGASHYLKWGENKLKDFFNSAWFPIMVASVFFIITLIFYSLSNILYHIMLLFAYIAFFSALDSLLRFKNRHISTGGAISHLGIALFLAAVLLTFSKQEVISKNTSGFSLGNAFSEQENLLLSKGSILPMGDYFVTYTGNEFDGERLKYTVDFLKKNKEGNFYKVFSSYPTILLNERMGNVYEPFAKIYPFKDIFTYITYAEIEKDLEGSNYSHIGKAEIAINDTIMINNDFLVLKDITSNIQDEEPDFNNITINAHIEFITHFGRSFNLIAKYEINEGHVIKHDAVIKELGLMFRFDEISDTEYTIGLDIFEDREEFIIIKTIVFPFINILWISLIIILAGALISMRSRWRNRNKTK